MRKPIIGLIPLVDVERESYWMYPGYMNWINRYWEYAEEYSILT